MSPSLDKLSCDCARENQVFDLATRACRCTENTYNDSSSGNCLRCPLDAASDGKTCICFDSNAVFDHKNAACRCRDDAVRIDQQCVVCPDGAKPDASQQFCVCAEGQVWFVDGNECVGNRSGARGVVKLGMVAVICGILFWAIRCVRRTFQ